MPTPCMKTPALYWGARIAMGGTPGSLSEGAEEGSHLYSEALEAAHVLPEYP